MIFNSVTFLLFLVSCICLYWLLPRRGRLWMLFFASITFYGFWRWEFVPLMVISSGIDYFVAQGLSRTCDRRKRRLLLSISLIGNLGLLFIFKYFIFVAENIWNGLKWIGLEVQPLELNIILPLGISFYTFQTISYTIDVYRGVIKAEKDFILYSCFVMYFPQLVAGPILRAGEIIFQLSERPKWSSRRTTCMSPSAPATRTTLDGENRISYLATTATKSQRRRKWNSSSCR